MSTKELKVRPVKAKGSVYEIYFEGGGQVPDTLKGLYTRISNAMQAIKYYTPPKTEKKVAKNESKNC